MLPRSSCLICWASVTFYQVAPDASRTAAVPITGRQGESRRLQGTECQHPGRRVALQPRVECEGRDGHDWPATQQHHSFCCGRKRTSKNYCGKFVSLMYTWSRRYLMVPSVLLCYLQKYLSPVSVFFFFVQATEPELTVLLYNKDRELVHLPLVHSGLAELEWSRVRLVHAGGGSIRRYVTTSWLKMTYCLN